MKRERKKYASSPSWGQIPNFSKSVVFEKRQIAKKKAFRGSFRLIFPNVLVGERRKIPFYRWEREEKFLLCF